MIEVARELSPDDGPMCLADGRWYVCYGVPGIDPATAEIQARIRSVLAGLRWVEVVMIELGPVEGFYYVRLRIAEPAAAQSMSLGLEQ